jgi:hypothetical protein
LKVGTAISIVMATGSLVTADDGDEVAAFTMSLVVCLLVSWGVGLVAWRLQRGSAGD